MFFSEMNMTAFRAINDLGKEYPFLNPAMIVLAEYAVFILALVMLVFWFTRNDRNRMMVIQAGVAFIIAEMIGKIAGQLYSNHQPFAVLSNVNKLADHAVDNSFPSDHTILFFSISFSFWLVYKKTGWIIFALSVAVSRIWVGVHYPFDVAAGALFGIISAVLSYWIVPRLALTKKVLTIYEKGEGCILPRKERSKNV
ncbi:undecaprenyl-diphosphatase [Bacillus velezensis]|uniref:undecaprenyl-diphosphatase n=1 Tax=Bacillus TaxID=1386 RepID=UPI000458718A|nr:MULTISPECIES: undecaprenyl-diphosphatase [Bacillus]AIW36681.1 bacitracin ABC transporter permease [Bacillus subtilis]AHZ14788.1 bacitracin transport permease [Bacillus velezensis SQR9]AKF77412.1 bacitracin ABC transporter permease [Bacillus velezensis]AWD13081.1 undecaprenyl-diphosphatase [Bacillus velezensis]MDH2303290.1 undecaprenyl-diphosphatase [Bacillus velezensis]